MYKTPNGDVVPAMGMAWVDFTDPTKGFVRLMTEADDEHQISTILTAKQAESLASVLRNQAGAIRAAYARKTVVGGQLQASTTKPPEQ